MALQAGHCWVSTSSTRDPMAEEISRPLQKIGCCRATYYHHGSLYQGLGLHSVAYSPAVASLQGPWNLLSFLIAIYGFFLPLCRQTRTRTSFTLSTLGFKIMESHSALYSQAADFDLQSAIRAQNVKALMNRYNQMEGLVKRLTEVGKCCIHLIIFY
jgi:hypothetical protein